MQIFPSSDCPEKYQWTFLKLLLFKNCTPSPINSKVMKAGHERRLISEYLHIYKGYHKIYEILQNLLAAQAVIVGKWLNLADKFALVKILIQFCCCCCCRTRRLVWQDGGQSRTKSWSGIRCKLDRQRSHQLCMHKSKRGDSWHKTLHQERMAGSLVAQSSDVYRSYYSVRFVKHVRPNEVVDKYLTDLTARASSLSCDHCCCFVWHWPFLIHWPWRHGKGNNSKILSSIVGIDLISL